MGDLIGWIVGLLVLIALIYWLMRQGWLWRRTQQSGIPPLPVAPKRGTAPILELEGRYFGSTTAGDWLDRIVAHRLGDRSLVELTLSAEGLNVVRPASTSFFVPITALRGARTDRGIAGKVVPDGGLLVVTWEHGDKLLDTGVRADNPDEHESWVTAVEVLLRAHAKVTGDLSNEHAASEHAASEHKEGA
ncbi:PH-like domain-containing protein [Streptacidiphilus sp. PAMC 29251]